MAGELLARAVQRDAADLEHVRVLGRGERDPRVLLDDEDGQPLVLVQAPGRPGRAPGRRSGARPSEGSSSSRSRGRETSARASASICCSPPLSVPACWLPAAGDAREVLERALGVALDRAAVAPGRAAEEHVLPDGQLAVDAAALGHVRDAEAGDRLGRAPADPLRRRRRSRRSSGPCRRSRAASSSCRRRSRRAARRPALRRPRARRRGGP